MSKDEKERLIKEFNADLYNSDWQPMSPEERARLTTLGKESGIKDEDVPFSFGDDFLARLGSGFESDSNNMLKGTIVDMAQKLGRSPDEILRDLNHMLKYGLTDPKKPRYDA